MERRQPAGFASLEREQQLDALFCLISTIQALQPKSPKNEIGHYHTGPKEKPSSEEIKLRAYQIFLEREGVPGSNLEDWLQAERELLGKVLKAHPRGEKL